jgi:hypothetical protein
MRGFIGVFPSESRMNTFFSHGAVRSGCQPLNFLNLFLIFFNYLLDKKLKMMYNLCVSRKKDKNLPKEQTKQTKQYEYG